MKIVRWILALLFLSSSIALIEPAVAQDTSLPVDLAAVPIGPDLMPESGYLVEGGGYFSDAEQVALFHGAPGGSGTNESNIAGSLQDSGWQRSYMFRMVLLADRENPGSDLLADEITLVHAFDSAADASEAVAMFDEFWRNSGDEIDGADEYATYRFIAESADSLVTTVAVDGVVAEIVSTDLTGRPDIANHEAVVAETLERMTAALDTPGTALDAVYVDDMKVTSFFDTPDSFQYYTVRDGQWLSPIEPSGEDVPIGLDLAYQSQQVVTLNNQSQIMIQIWLGSFTNAEDGAAFRDSPYLPARLDPMFAKQGIAEETSIVDGQEIYKVGVQMSDGELATGYRGYVSGNNGTTVGLVSMISTGNVLIDPADVAALAIAQQACLDGETACPALSLDDILVAESTDETPEASPEGTYVDPQFGWSVDYADAGWEFSSVEGETILELQNGRSIASIETVVDRHGDPTRCILEEVRLLEEFEEHAYITLGSDIEGAANAGSEAGHVWAIYTVEPLADERADQEYTIRIDCYTLIEGDASLVVHHSAPRDMWESESAKGDDLRANIDISGVAAATSDGTGAQVRNADTMVPRIWIPRAA